MNLRTLTDAKIHNKKAILLKEHQMKELTDKINVLKKLCREIDPYNPLDMQTVKILDSLNIKNQDDPFNLTNQILLMLEDSIEKQEKMKNEYPEVS